MLRGLLLLLPSVLLLAQSGGPALNTAYAMETFVTGHAAVDAGPVTVYDISYPARVKLGEGQVDRGGNFAVNVDPRLKQGNRLVVEDRVKRVSVAITVQAARPGPAPRPQK